MRDSSFGDFGSLYKNSSPDVIVDECLSGGFIDELRRRYPDMCIVPAKSVREGISDNEIINLANSLGIPIITLNEKHFSGYCKLILLHEPESSRKYTISHERRISLWVNIAGSALEKYHSLNDV